MLVRAFGSQLDEHAREDAYSSAWAASLAALGPRVDGMSDTELRNYLFAAITTHAGKELRRRGRKPAELLGDDDPGADAEDDPAERLVHREEQHVLRDALGSLPERRRRVVTLRYAVGLSPEEICELVDGLTPRSYRKEITRGIKDLASGLALIQSGERCSSLSGEIQAFAKGQASGASQELARAHLSHCSECSRAVRALATSLHDMSLMPVTAVVAGAGVSAGSDGAGALAGIDRIGDKLKDAYSSLAGRVGESETVVTAVAGGGTRGGGSAVIAGIGAKLGALSAAGKVAVGCIGAGASLATCVATGVVPAAALKDALPGDKPQQAAPSAAGAGKEAEATLGTPAVTVLEPAPAPPPVVTITKSRTGGERTTPPRDPKPSTAPAPDSANDSTEPEPVIAPQTVTPIESESAPEVAAATSTGAGGDGADGGGARDPVRQADAAEATSQVGTP